MAKEGYEHMSPSDMETGGEDYGFAARVAQASGSSWTSTPPTDEFEHHHRYQVGSQEHAAATVVTVPGYPVIMPTAPLAPVAGLVVQDPLHMGRREWKQARRERKRARRMSRRSGRAAAAGPVQALFGLVRNAILSTGQDHPHPHPQQQQLQNHQNQYLQGHTQNPQPDHQSYQSYQIPRPGYQ